MNRIDFQQLADLRVREAEALRTAGCLKGAYYLLGYAVECALKACFCKRILEHEFPDKRLVERAYTHDLTKLLDVSGVEAELDKAVGLNPAVGLKWRTVNEWNEQSRYVALLHASKLDDPTDGVLIWLKTQW